MTIDRSAANDWSQPEVDASMTAQSSADQLVTVRTNPSVYHGETQAPVISFLDADKRLAAPVLKQLADELNITVPAT